MRNVTDLLKDPAARTAPQTAIYTCPMHPEVRQVGPGFCPICGMALEPVTASTVEGPSAELANMTKRFWIGLILAAPVFVLEMASHIGNHHVMPPRQVSNWIQFALGTPVVLWAGWPFFVRGWASLVSRRLNMFTLIAMGVGVAWVSLAPAITPCTSTHRSQ